jgi:hypothetical protein
MEDVMTDPITNPLGLDRPEREDDPRDAVHEWQRFKLGSELFRDLLKEAAELMARAELERVKQLRDRMVNKA